MQKINEANWSVFFYCDQTTNHQDSELLPTNYFVIVKTCICVDVYVCARTCVCNQQRGTNRRENMIIFVWVDDLLTRVTESLTATAWEAVVLVCVWYVQYVDLCIMCISVCLYKCVCVGGEVGWEGGTACWSWKRRDDMLSVWVDGHCSTL